MQAFWNWLKGKKTYILCAVGIGLVALEHAGISIPGVHIDDNAVWQAATVAALRHGVANS